MSTRRAPLPTARRLNAAGGHPNAGAGGYRALEHTGDVVVQAWAPDLPRTLANLGKALFAVMVDLRTVRVRQWRRVEAEAPDAESLAVEWLNALLFDWETSRMLVREVNVTGLMARPGRWRVRARCGGEPLDEGRHVTRTHVKAATYHGVHVRGADGPACTVRVLLDI